MRSIFNKLQWKIVTLFFLSVALTFATLMIVKPILQAVYDNHFKALYPFVEAVIRVNRIFGFSVWQAVVVIMLFIFYCLILSWGTTRNLTNIIRGVQRMSSGNTDVQIPVRSKDELGLLAGQINALVSQLEASREEERLATQAKNDLITNVSHDLRTPLTSIIGYLRLIEEDKYKDEVELRYYVNIAYEKSKRMNRLVNDLFDYTRMGFGQIPLHRTPIDLVQLIGQLTAEFSLQLRNQDMEIVFSPPQEKLMIQADGDKIMQAFENLITNAMRYGNDGKQIRVEAKKSEQEAEVRVINYGPPIPPMDLPYIFERFYRVEKSRSLDTGGAGLGLAIVKSIIELHDGQIYASSNTAETAFIVKLPLIDLKA